MTGVMLRISTVALALSCWPFNSALGLAPCGNAPDPIFDNGFGIGPSISASAETALTIPSGLAAFPDEHSSYLPPSALNANYLFFEAGRNSTGAGAIVLETSDLQTFTFPQGYVSPVLGPPLSFSTCSPTYDSEFDENYASPGSVTQDPTLPPGNLIMVYEGENHCRGGNNVQPFYATAGFARSADNGVTWPGPSVSPTADRYPIIGGPDPEPTDPTNPTAIGDAIPSVYVEGSCLYVIYVHRPAPGSTGNHGAIQMARAQLGVAGTLAFNKYLVTNDVGGFTSPGLTGAGTDIVPFIPAPGTASAAPQCAGAQMHPGLSYNDAIRRYLATMVCQVAGGSGDYAWFFSTATSLDAEDWTPPRMIANTRSAATACGVSGTGLQFDGWYPSFYSVGSSIGHTDATGVAFYLNGCEQGNPRVFTSRPLMVTPDPN